MADSINKARARELRNNPTGAESVLWQHLRRRQIRGCKFRRQHPLGPYMVDSACLEKSLVVELDGGQNAEQAVWDAERSAWLEERGFRVLRFWNNEVLTETEAVKEAIWEALA